MDDETINIPVKEVLIYLLVLARVGGIVSFAPFWNMGSTPKQVKIALAMVLALIVSFQLRKGFPLPTFNYLSFAILIAGELVIGSLIGFISQLVLSALDSAAQILATQVGFSLASIINPTNRTQTTALGIVAQMLGLTIFLAIDGHHSILTATISSFKTFVPGDFVLSDKLFFLLVKLSADALAMGVALAAPAIIILFVVEILIALVGRIAPQIQVMLISFPIKILFALAIVGSCLYSLPQHIRQILKVLISLLKSLFTIS